MMDFDHDQLHGPLEIVYVPCGRPGHRGYPTNGVFDGVCNDCEAEMSEAAYHEDCDEDDWELHGCRPIADSIAKGRWKIGGDYRRFLHAQN